jgi:hypothetical protein
MVVLKVSWCDVCSAPSAGSSAPPLPIELEAGGGVQRTTWPFPTARPQASKLRCGCKRARPVGVVFLPPAAASLELLDRPAASC